MNIFNLLKSKKTREKEAKKRESLISGLEWATRELKDIDESHWKSEGLIKSEIKNLRNGGKTYWAEYFINLAKENQSELELKRRKYLKEGYKEWKQDAIKALENIFSNMPSLIEKIPYSVERPNHSTGTCFNFDIGGDERWIVSKADETYKIESYSGGKGFCEPGKVFGAENGYTLEEATRILASSLVKPIHASGRKIFYSDKNVDHKTRVCKDRRHLINQIKRETGYDLRQEVKKLRKS